MPSAYDYLDPLTFDHADYIRTGGLLGRENPELATNLVKALTNPDVDASQRSKIRKKLTKYDPLLFAVLYFPHLLRDPKRTDLPPSVARFHLDIFGWALDALPYPDRDDRAAFIAPRGSGKSTTLFVICAIWTLAHRHRLLISAYAHMATQAQNHLNRVRREFSDNELLRQDHSALTTPKTRSTGVSEADRSDLYIAKSGVGFAARGIDTATRGLIVGENRPDLLLFDDIEPGESNYGDTEVEKRRHTLFSDVIGGDSDAAIVFAGTVTRSGSIMHDILRQVTDKPEEAPQWPRDENIACYYYPALVTQPDGSKRSFWENGPKKKWTTEDMLANCHKWHWQLEMMNNPAGKQGKYWGPEDFTYGTLGDLPGQRWILQVDPAVTTKDTSDWTGLAVVAYRPPMPGEDGKQSKPTVEVVEAYGVKLSNESLRQEVLKILERNPRIRYVRIEVNQGGELWGGPVDDRGKPLDPTQGVFHHLPPGVELRVFTTKQNKETKFAEAHDFYQHAQYVVLHRDKFGDLEGQMREFPKGKHDDIADAVVMGELYYLKKPVPKQKVSTQEYSYI